MDTVTRTQPAGRPAEATLDQQLWIDALVQHDRVFGTTASIGVAVRCLKRQLPPASQALKPMDHVFFRRRGDAKGRNIAYRLSAPIERLQMVVFTQDPVVATDLGGTPLNFLHVVPGAAGPALLRTRTARCPPLSPIRLPARASSTRRRVVRSSKMSPSLRARRS